MYDYRRHDERRANASTIRRTGEGQPLAEEPEQDSQKVQIPENMSYAEYLKLINPDKSDAEIAKMIRKENRYTWLGRFQILAFLVIIILIIALIVTNN